MTTPRQSRLLFRRFSERLTVDVNRKGVLDVDTVKGCRLGMGAHPNGGCYQCCYAAKMAALYGYDFAVSVSRKPLNRDVRSIEKAVALHPASWFRVGTMGDPCHDWENTVGVCEWLGKFKTPVVITKHWEVATDSQVQRLASVGAIVHTSISALDSPVELKHRLGQLDRFRLFGVKSMARLVSARFGNTETGNSLAAIQDGLFQLSPIIDNPLRVPATDDRVARGDIIVSRVKDIQGLASISIARSNAYVGVCGKCPDQCGAVLQKQQPGSTIGIKNDMQIEMFQDEVKFEHVKTVIGSGYEKDIAVLAVQDGIAKRAARKNMQIHSAIVIKVNGAFSGFFTFQVNHECREFCLLQSVIKPENYNPERYRAMAAKVIEQNTFGYPSIITTDPKSKFETPELFESLGFVTYLKMSGFHYMVKGELKDVRMKLLAHITMTNVWNTVKGDWLRLKREWNERIEAAGEKYGVKNPTYATREGCWQGESGYSNVVNTKRSLDDNGNVVATTKAHNSNASVLDPVACEVLARFFMPKGGGRVYNPFGGGVQFGFVSGACGYEYLASEIRQNQCDANNALCGDFPNVKWIKSDSSTFVPDGEFDLVFTCPPYYRVEKYIDYDGAPPAGELNSMATYQQFRDLLFAGYKQAIEKLKDNRFFVIMTGDSRDKNGAYYCSEAETELFLRDCGLSVYNKIIYLECEFTRLAQAKKTLNYRKFPKREQKIIVAFKGDMKQIKDLFAPVGRL